MSTKEMLENIASIIKDITATTHDNIIATTVIKELNNWDSLTHIKFTVALENLYNIKFSIKEVVQWKTINDVIECIEKKNINV